MKVIKLDRRYAGFPKWNYALQFPIRGRLSEKTGIYKYARILHDTYGPDTTANPNRAVGDWSKPYWIHNEFYHKDIKRGRIYLKNQADITMLLLKIDS